jgi:hypothetical protein
MEKHRLNKIIQEQLHGELEQLLESLEAMPFEELVLYVYVAEFWSLIV